MRTPFLIGKQAPNLGPGNSRQRRCIYFKMPFCFVSVSFPLVLFWVVFPLEQQVVVRRNSFRCSQCLAMDALAMGGCIAERNYSKI